MTNKELISSGELELYVAGMVSDGRAVEISNLIKTDKDIKKEVEAIEKIIMKLAKESTVSKQQDFSKVLKQIVSQRVLIQDGKTISKNKNKTSKYILLNSYIGWAAAAVFLIFFAFQYQQNLQVTENLMVYTQINEELENKIKAQNFSLDQKEELLSTVISENTKMIDLAGQEVSPESLVKVFWNTEMNKVVIEAENLPEAPEGMVYQVWSLTLEPLIPTSIGLLEDYSPDKALFTFYNPNASEAFGITLEPAGGSKTPTLEQLYVLGALKA